MNARTPIRIFIADDHAMVRMGLSSLFGAKPGFTVVGEAEDGDSTIERVRALKPNVVIMDLLMPGTSGATATAKIHAVLPEVRILILTSFSSSDGILRALNAGASGAVMKSSDFTTLADAVEKIAAGETVIAPEIQQLIDEDPPAEVLTDRQMEILESVIRGLTNAEIATQFGIREGSVKEHVASICAKLGAGNRSEAVAIALRKHLLKI